MYMVVVVHYVYGSSSSSSCCCCCCCDTIDTVFSEVEKMALFRFSDCDNVDSLLWSASSLATDLK